MPSRMKRVSSKKKEIQSKQVLDAHYPNLPNDLNKHSNDNELYQAFKDYFRYASEKFKVIDMRILCTRNVLRSLLQKGSNYHSYCFI